MSSPQIDYSSLDTPCVLLDLNKLEANIEEMSRLASEAGVRLRPHIKIHQSTYITRLQVAAGACGIEVGTIDQAEVFAAEGFPDIMIGHPFYGTRQFAKLRGLINQPNLKLALVVDMLEQARGISEVARSAGKKIAVVLKIDTGGNRFGVLPGESTVKLAAAMTLLPGIDFQGIYTHEVYSGDTAEGADEFAREICAEMCETAEMLKQKGIPFDHVSVGASPTYRAVCRLKQLGKFPQITEIHPGSCIIGSMLQVRRFAMKEDDCAMTILTGVMSTSHPAHAVIDAGAKTLGSDPLIAFRDRPDYYWNGKPGYGVIRGRPDLWLGVAAAESSIMYYTGPGKKFKIGDRLEIIPNNPFLVTNIHDKLYGVRDGEIETIIPVTGRGRGS